MSNKDINLRGIDDPRNSNDKGPQKGTAEKLNVYNWLADLPEHKGYDRRYVEVRFKNTRKGFYENTNNLRLKKGDIVAVEASPGHDIGVVSLTGELVLQQMRKYYIVPEETEFKKIYRKAKPADIDKWVNAIEAEDKTMIKSRQIAADLKLDMKIGDVEYQGDKTKAIFYYIADERVDFRQLIKVLADEFRVRIEMKQIGARQEAGRIGGIGSCGRQLCCATWLTNFSSVTTNSARYQEVSLNPQKLAGQCSKLKCCLNYELSVYLDAQEDFPPKDIPLETKEGKAFYQKSDFFRRLMWYAYTEQGTINPTPIPVARVKEIIELNKEGKKPEKLIEIEIPKIIEKDYSNVVGQDSLTRFDDKKPKKKKRKKRKPRFNKKINKKNGRNKNQ